MHGLLGAVLLGVGWYLGLLLMRQMMGANVEEQRPYTRARVEEKSQRVEQLQARGTRCPRRCRTRSATAPARLGVVAGARYGAMLETPRIGLPKLVGQGELLARTRGAQAGAEHAARDTIAARHCGTRRSRRAEELPPTQRSEEVNRDAKGRDEQGTSGERRAAQETTTIPTMERTGATWT